MPTEELPMSDAGPPVPESPRRAELLDLAYGYVLDHGIESLSLRPLAKAIGSSPRVLLYLFGSKDELVRELLARVRTEQLAGLRAAFDRPADAAGTDPGVDELVDRVWTVLGAPEQRPLVRLTYEAFLGALRPDAGPWTGFAAEQLGDWLDVLRDAQPATAPRVADARATRALAIVRGLLLDLLARDEPDRVRSALRQS
ncbi:TetR/AcrR family transcriptional regulator [Pseudonocardia phyllosphaerae]|uniref:TetR/AcrR family transcriptional regulator n=1 Tax=Pseudonocardia phyllosphaerae TaxID=3390502 RepID=UPI003978A667